MPTENTFDNTGSSTLTLAYSPDPDDAFMWWPLHASLPGGARVNDERFLYEHVQADIESLNISSETGVYDITAISCAQYAKVCDRYALLSCGSSFGEGYGPRLVAREARTIESLHGIPIAVPGLRTTASAIASLVMGEKNYIPHPVPFDRIPTEIARGTFEAGIVIHEAQLSYSRMGLVLLLDLGKWWENREDGLPLPLGVNTLLRDLDERHGEGAQRHVAGTLRRSILYAMNHHEEGLQHAMYCAQDPSPALVEEFVKMYVNRRTLSPGISGQESIQRLIQRMYENGLLQSPASTDFITP